MANERVLSLRELNRTTLARQLLLERAQMASPAGVERLVGLQAQVARPPYVGLWTRLRDFRRADLAAEIDAHRIVKATFLRGTLHLVTADDYLTFRATLQPVLTAALETIVKERGASVDVPRLVAEAREFMRAEPRSFAELTTLFTGLFPDGDPGAMRYAVRTHLPLVQVPVPKGWSYPGNPRFTPAETWLDTHLPDKPRLPELVRRYLAAFGPATVNDMQTWSYLANLQPVFDALEADLVRYRDARGRVLYDLPDLPIEASDAPSPIRFMAEFDNLVMAHQDRARFVPPAYRARVYLPALRVAATVLIDGFVAASWSTERVKQVATLVISPFEPPDKGVRRALIDEGEGLVRFIEPDARAYEVQVDA